MRGCFLHKTTLSSVVTQALVLLSAEALAQASAPPQPAASSPAGHKEEESQAQRIVVTGQRKALESAQKIKREAEEVVDSIVADEAGKLPDRSIAEVLQRVPGVTIDRVGNKSD